MSMNSGAQAPIEAQVDSTDTGAPTIELLRGLRVLVVGVNFAPEQTGISPYTTDLSDQLSEAGASVQVLTGVPHYPSWTVPREYRRRLRVAEARGAVRVTRARHYVPASQSVIRRSLFEVTFMCSSYFAGKGLTADVVVAVTPALGAVPSASAIARRNGVPLGVIVQDLLGPGIVQSGMGARLTARITARLEAHWLRAAQAIAVISRAFVPVLLSAGIDESRLVYLPNYTHVDADVRSRAEARRALDWPEEGFYVVHTGNIGLKQDLSNVVRAAFLAQTSRDDFRFAIVGDGSQRAAVERLASGLDRLTILPPVSNEDYPAVLAAADVLLVNERETVRDMSLPSKLTSYLAAGRPIVAATRWDGETAREVMKSGGGIVVEPNNPGLLVDAIRRLASDRQLRERLARDGKAYASHSLSRAVARRRLLAFVANLAQRTATFE